jgi:hypothetical protein
MVRLGELTQRWAQDARRRGARWFGIACACLPVLEVQDANSVVDAVLAGLAVGAWPAVPLRVWGLLLWLAACGVAAGRLMAWVAPRSRMRLFAACALLHAGFALASGLRVTGLVALACFGVSFAALRAAREAWPPGHPGAPG